MSDLDLDRLGDIPDPFADSAQAPMRPMSAAPRPASPTRSRVRAARVVALASAVVFDAGWFAFVERRHDLATLAPVTVLAGLGLPLAAAVLALLAVARPGRRGLGGRATELAAMVLAPPLLFAGGTLLVAPADSSGSAFVGHALRCALATAFLAAGPFALGLLALRRSFAAAASWRTAALGVACGGLAAATMSVSCPDSGVLHVIVAHGTMMLFAGLAGAWAGARITRA